MKCKRCGRNMTPKTMNGEKYLVCEYCKVRRKIQSDVKSVPTPKSRARQSGPKRKVVAIMFFVIVAAIAIFILFPTSKNLVKSNFEVRDSVNAMGDKIGEYGYVGMSKPELKKTTQEEFKKFIEDHVKNSGLDYVSIVCGDGTGIVFQGSLTEFAEYGTIDLDTNIITLKKGDIVLSPEGNYHYEEVK